MGSGKADKKESSPYEVIRGMWEVPYAAQFVNLFQTKFDFADINIQDLEDALIDSSSVLLDDICARILRFLTEDSSILISTFEEHLKSLLNKYSFNCSLVQGQSWHLLAPDERVLTLKWLIDHALAEKEEELMEHLDDHHSPDDLRGICAGQDAFNNLYWYLDDLRLYRENCAKKVNKKEWECVCSSLTEWYGLLKQFRKTSNYQERQLHTYLSQELFPIIQHQLMSASNIKNSSLSNKELLMKEKKQMDAMFEHNNKINAAPPDVSVAKPECNGIVALPPSASEDSKVSPLAALQQQHENLLVNGDIGEPKLDTSSECKNKNNVSDCVAASETSNNGNFSPTDVKIEPKNRTSDSVVCSTAANGVLTNGKDNVDPGLNGSIKTSPVENVVGCDGVRNNVDCKPVEGSKTIAPQAQQQQMPAAPPPSAQPITTVPPQPSQQPPCLSHIPDVKDEKLPLPNVNNSNINNNNNSAMGPTALQQHSAPHSVAMALPAQSATVQPLPSNVLNKTSVSSLDAQYMQQQSQIFVFSTALANEGADAVLQGHYQSIIMYHCDQPGTKAFLEKHPLKIHQFTRQNPAAWLNTLSQMKSSKNVRFGINQGAGPQPPHPQVMNQNIYGAGPCPNPRMSHPGCGGPNNSCGPTCWSGGPQSGPAMCNSTNCCPPTWSQPTHMMQPNKCESQGAKVVMNPRGPRPPVMSCGPGPCSHGPPGPAGPACSPINHASPNQMMAQNAMDGNQMVFPAGKVPDQNLTPQQRQHRVEQVATILKVHEMLLPPNLGNPADANCNTPISSSTPPVHQPDTSPQMTTVPPNNFNGNMPRMPCPSSQSSTNPAQIEWQKLENQFYEEKKRKIPVTSNNNYQFCQQNQSPNVPLPIDPNVNGPRMHGPPPPYPQQSPIRTSAPEPSPISTMSPASTSLSLPSPHSNVPTTSINSPAAPRMPHPSPGSALPPCSSAPLTANSMHSTPLNSPSPALNNSRSVSNPSTPCAPVMTSTSPGLRMQDSMSTGPLTPNSNSNQTVTAEGTFGRTLQSYAQSSQQRCAGGGPPKEPSLMPVPSPQQIQYSSTFDGQELPILKQPNTGMRNNDQNIMSPANLHSADNGPQFPASSPVNKTQQPQGPATPQYCSPGDHPVPRVTPEAMGARMPMDGPYPGMNPQGSEHMQRFAAPSPHQNVPGMDPSNYKMAPSPHGDPASRFPTGPNQRFMNPNAIQRFPSPGPNMNMDPNPRFRAPCPSPHHGGSDQMSVPHKYQAMSSPQSAPMDRFPNPAQGDGSAGARMKYPAPLAPSSGAGAPMLNPQGGSIPTGALSPHMQSLQKMAASFDMIGTPLSNKMQNEIQSTSPFGAGGSNSNPGSVNSNAGAASAGPAPEMGGQKLSHFDPLASMAELSAQSGSSSTTAPSSNSQSNIMSGTMTSMNMSSMQYSGPNSGQSVMSSVQNVQGMPQNMGPSPGPGNQSMPGGVPQTVNNTYVNATMSIQQLNIQNASANAYNANVQVQPISAHPPVGQPPQTAMYSHVHPNISPKGSMVMPANNTRCAHPQHFMPQGQMPGHRVMSPNPMPPNAMAGPMHRQPAPEPRPFNGANVQVKATAPNTIQYLPSRPQRMSTATNRPPSLEFLNRFTSPLANLDSKVPTQNLQYFPNAPGNNMVPNQNMGVPMNPMMGQPPAMNGAMMEPMDSPQMMQRPPQQMMMRGAAPQQIMGSDQMCGGPVMQPNPGPMQMMNDPNFSGPMPNQMMNMQMMGPSGPQQMYMGAKPAPGNIMPPDASQHLPPTMGGPQPPIMPNNNYKSNFVGPPTTDPNYAVQFHNFQQQLYATNPRANGPTGPQMNNPNVMGAHQQY